MGNANSEVIISLCSRLCLGENMQPLEPKEWSILAQKLVVCKKQPKDLFEFSDNDFVSNLGIEKEFISRLKRLLDRTASLTFEISKLNSMGIKIITRADKAYPTQLKHCLKTGVPPLFYTAGDLSLLNKNAVGFVGSRTVSEQDFSMTENIVKKSMSDFVIVSGGAKGIDTIATECSLNNGGYAIEYLSDSMIKKIRNKDIIKCIQDGNLLLLSAVSPDAGFNIGMAMQRNKYIYAQARAVFVIKSDLEKGGTWAGAIEALRNKYSTVYCWNNINYNGNQALIKKGALPIDESFDISKIESINDDKIKFIQASMFD